MAMRLARTAASIAALALVCGASAAPGRARQPRTPRGVGSAYRIIDLDSGQVLAQSRADLIETPVAPGSILKLVTLVAASEAGILDRHTTVVCRRTLSVAGTTLTCVHPDLHRAMDPVEAIAHSCNYYFATIASRVPRSALNAVLARLGLAPIPAATPPALGALGLGGVRASPAALLGAFIRLAGPASSFQVSGRTRQLLIDGVSAAAREGTASAFKAAGLTALAKTGTAPMPGGGYHGIAVALLTDQTPRLGIVVLAAGGAGADAAELAAKFVVQFRSGRRLERARSEPMRPEETSSIRIGESSADGRRRVRIMPLEDYVASVVSGESEDRMRPAAREALAIAARTFALANLGRHGSEGFDLCDLTHCQVLGKASVSAQRAAHETAGEVLLDAGRPARVYFSAWCGGHTEHPSAVWAGSADPPFLISRPDPACAKREGWTSDVPAARLLDALHRAGLRGSDLRGLRVSLRTLSGRAARIEAAGLAPTEIDAETFRLNVGRVLGWQVLKSTLFVITRSAGGFSFAGRGSGHGVGLCLVGADERAKGGADTRSILEFYYPGLRVGGRRPAGEAADRPSQVPGGALQVLLPEADRSELPALKRAALRAIDDTATALRQTPPERITIRFHPTTASFHEATGTPWWVAGSSRSNRIELLPLAALRQRGILESTLRHEMVHVLTDRDLAGRPLWVREGLATYLAGEWHAGGDGAAPGTPASSSCPQDGEFSQRADFDTARGAYGRAAACVQVALAAGRSWRDLR